jgi:hypothetical protein
MFPIFATAWALAVLFHLATAQGAGRNAASALLLVSAMATIVFPGAGLSLVVLSACQIVQFWQRLPMRAQTSEYFKAICGVCLIATYIPQVQAQGTAWIATGPWFLSFAPLLRLTTSLLFFASVLHKLNSGFFIAERSDAGKIIGPLLSAARLPRSGRLLAALPYGTVLAELFVAAGLLFPATRAAAVTTLLLLFFAIGLRGVVQFAWLMYAVALLFCDDRLAAPLLPYVATAPSPRHVLFAAACCGFFAAAIAFRRRETLLLLVAGTTVLTLPALVAWSAAALRGAPAVWTGASLPLSGGEIVLLVLFSLNEMGPYVGYKDWPTFRMYSNLESGSDMNHLFLRGWLFTPFFKRRQEVLLPPPMVELIPYRRFKAGGDLYLPLGSLAAVARDLTSAEALRRSVDDAHQGADAAARGGRTAGSWLDLAMPPRFFFHYPCARPWSAAASRPRPGGPGGPGGSGG